jgi:hypothetical protein
VRGGEVWTIASKDFGTLSGAFESIHSLEFDLGRVNDDIEVYVLVLRVN